MGRRYRFCVRCRRTITDAELKRELYVQSEEGVLCATCAQRLDEAAEQPKPPPPPQKKPEEAPAPVGAAQKVASEAASRPKSGADPSDTDPSLRTLSPQGERAATKAGHGICVARTLTG